MSPFYDFKSMLATKLTQRLGTFVKASELFVGNYYTATSKLVTATKEMIVEVTYHGVLYYVLYDRATLQIILAEYAKYANVMVNDATTVNDVIASLNKSGANLNVANFTLSASRGVYGQRTLTADSVDLRGQLDFYTQAPQYPLPLHYWTFNGTNGNSGTSGSPVAQASTFVTFAGQKWAAVGATENYIDIGAALSINTDFTIDFWTVCNQPDNLEYGHIFTHSKILTSTYPDGCLHTWRNIAAAAFNKPMINGIGYSNYANSMAPKLLNDVPTRITIKRTGNVWSWYTNGGLVWTFNASLALNPWQFFGSWYRRSKQYIRDLRYWPSALSDSDLFAVLSERQKINVAPPALHEWKLTSNLLNTGSDGRALTAPFTFKQTAGKSWGSLSGTAPVAFGNGIELPMYGNYTLDFEVYLAAISSYATFMTTDLAGKAPTGSLLFYNGQIYEYGIIGVAAPVATALVPTKITFVAGGGTTKLYVDGVLTNTYATTATQRSLKGFRDLDSGTAEWPDTYGLRNLRYYNRTLVDDELQQLLIAND